VNAGAGFDVLSQEFREDYLLGKKFGADGEVRLLIPAAAAEKARKKEKYNAEAQRTQSERREEHDREQEKNLTQSSRRAEHRGQREERQRSDAARSVVVNLMQFLVGALPSLG
jgi:hypothetical protein